jgi:hypothetical protein
MLSELGDRQLAELKRYVCAEYDKRNKYTIYYWECGGHYYDACIIKHNDTSEKGCDKLGWIAQAVCVIVDNLGTMSMEGATEDDIHDIEQKADRGFREEIYIDLSDVVSMAQLEKNRKSVFASHDPAESMERVLTASGPFPPMIH